MNVFHRRLGGIVALSAMIVSTSLASASGSDGFGNSGYALLGGPGITELGVQRSGRIVLNSGFYVGALEADGAHDPQFASRDVSGGPECDDGSCYHDFAMQRDDRMVVAGQHSVFRLNANGTADTTFGTRGRVVVRGLRIQSVAVTSSGAILVAGAKELSDGSLGPVGGEVLLTRLLPSGAVDASFGRGGRTSLEAGLGWPVLVASQSDGGVILFALGNMQGSTVARLRVDGSVDTDFGARGFTTLARFEGRALTVQSDGRIVVGGLQWPAGSGYPLGGVARLDVRGRPDMSFGQDGIATLHKDRSSGHVDVIRGLVLEPDGSIVTAGAAVNASCCRGSYAFLATVTADGRSTHFAYVGLGPDPDHDDCFEEDASAVAVQPDAKIVVGGSLCGHGSWISRFGSDLRLDEGSALQLRRLQPGRGPARAVRETSHVRLTTTVQASAAGNVVVSVRPAKLFETVPGELSPVASGTRVLLLPGSSVGATRLGRASRTVAGGTSPSGRVVIRLRLSTRSFPRGSWGIATVRAADPRGRSAELEVEFVAR